MKISYYPGCTLKTKAKQLDVTARLCAKALGVEMEEIENWQCCGAVYPMGTDEIATKLSAVRALDHAKHNGGKLLTLCSACHNVIKRTTCHCRVTSGNNQTTLTAGKFLFVILYAAASGDYFYRHEKIKYAHFCTLSIL